MKKLRWILYPVMIAAAVWLMSRSQRTNDEISYASVLTVSVSAGDVRQEIRPWMPDEDSMVFFIPSFVESERAVFRLHTASKVTLDGTPLKSGMSVGGLDPDAEHSLEISGHKPVAFRLVTSSGVATAFIETASGNMDAVHADKRYKEAGRITLYTKDGRLEYRSAGRDKIRGRGQWTWKQEKKSYNLYLDRPSDLLGMGSSDRWALISNTLDETNLRNWLAYRFAEQISPYEGFSQKCEFADVYLNGQYNGLYLLCERVGIGQNRLEIPPDSYLFSLDAADRIDDMDTAFLINGGTAVEIRNPEPCTAEAADCLKTHLLSMQNALLCGEEESGSGKHWSEYIDMDSWARKYLVEEILMNYDAGAQSQYFFLEPGSDTVFAGPCWDYDDILGVFGRGMTPNCFLARREWKSKTEYTPWFGALWKKDAFSDYVKELYARECRPALQSFLQERIAGQAEAIRTAALSDRLRWPVQNRVYASYEEALEQMLGFLGRRIGFLDSAWIDGQEYCTITLKTARKQYRFFCVPPGEICRDLPTPESFGIKGKTHWQREDTGEDFPYDTPVFEDTDLFAAQ
ncbi:MAG: CotH kinase family protein [Clostridia bacterium]|nr:CotH kinase family protein [Clostridia bacterium]